jgi:hypothetical protein
MGHSQETSVDAWLLSGDKTVKVIAMLSTTPVLPASGVYL